MSIPCAPPTTCENHVLQSHFEDSYHEGEAELATHAAENKSPINEDAVRISLRIDNQIIEDAWFQAGGCVICQAAASVICEAVEGQSTEDATNLSAEQFLEVVGDPLPTNRQRCVLLAWRVFQRALQTPIDGERETDDDSIHFGGPSLSEES